MINLVVTSVEQGIMCSLLVSCVLGTMMLVMVIFVSSVALSQFVLSCMRAVAGVFLQTTVAGVALLP